MGSHFMKLLTNRCHIVYPWTQRYFGTFGDLNSAAAIMGNKKVANHGITVLNGLERAVQNMDDIKNTYVELSILHSEKLHVDPDNFRRILFLQISLESWKQQVWDRHFGLFLGRGFTPDVQAAWQKFLTVVVSAG
ncbi:hemoglobin subunit beta-1-like [Salvelinus fontinalis]|uniref:hemoglobin subunit beta-1-like n=1 Tax=Salvelinus fontinalis TaxID=8038 RepID=UPI0024851B79|nr:hemoglobin subunit beta-1-like [Salvelinus fontinalis]